MCVLGLAAALLLPGEFALAEPSLRLHPPENQQVGVAERSCILQEETGIRPGIDATDELGDDPVDSLLDGSADLAIIENTRAFEEGLRVVLILYQAVVHLSVRDGFEPHDYGDPDRPLQVEIRHNSHTATRIAAWTPTWCTRSHRHW